MDLVQLKRNAVAAVMLLIATSCVRCFTVNDANNVHTAVFTGYNPLVRPSSTTTVTLELVLFTINSLDMKTQTLSSTGWLTVIWNDPRLVWTPASYGNITNIFTLDKHVWKPEIIIDNSMDNIAVIADHALMFKVMNNGTVEWKPPGVYNTHCEVDITWFPFDRQTCSIEVASWSHTVDQVNLEHMMDHINTEDYQRNGEWDLVGTDIQTTYLTDIGEVYSQLKFLVNLKRKPNYYILNIIFAVVLISVLIPAVFLLPCHSGERISFIVTVLLALAVLLTIVADKMPTTSIHTSVIGIYLVITLGMATVAVIVSALLLHLYHMDDEKMPVWINHFVRAILLKKCKKNNPRKIDDTLHDVTDEDKNFPLCDKAVPDNDESLKEKALDQGNICDKTYLTNQKIVEHLDWALFLVFSTISIFTTFIFLLILAVVDK